MHRLQTVAHVGQSPVHDGRQGIGEITLLERRLQIDRLNVVAAVIGDLLWYPMGPGLVSWLGKRLNAYKLAYLHVMRADFLGQQKGDVLTPARQAYEGVLIGNMGYSPIEASSAVESGQLDAVAFGVPFLANPDLPARIKAGAQLNPADPNTFYTRGAAGYTDYPFMQ